MCFCLFQSACSGKGDTKLVQLTHSRCTAEYEKDITYVFTALALNATWADPISSLQAVKESNTFLAT